MADKHDYSEVISEMLIQLQKHSSLLDEHGATLKKHGVVLDNMLVTQERILDRLDRSEAGFNHFAGAVLDHLSAIRSDLRDVRTTVFQDHEDRLRRLEDFMRRAS